MGSWVSSHGYCRNAAHSERHTKRVRAMDGQRGADTHDCCADIVDGVQGRLRDILRRDIHRDNTRQCRSIASQRRHLLYERPSCSARGCRVNRILLYIVDRTKRRHTGGNKGNDVEGVHRERQLSALKYIRYAGVGHRAGDRKHEDDQRQCYHGLPLDRHESGNVGEGLGWCVRHGTRDCDAGHQRSLCHSSPKNRHLNNRRSACGHKSVVGTITNGRIYQIDTGIRAGDTIKPRVNANPSRPEMPPVRYVL